MVGRLLTRALGAQVGRRLAAALLVFLLLTVAAGGWTYLRVTETAFAREAETAAQHYRDRFMQGLDGMEEQAVRLKSGMDFSRVLLEPGDDWFRLKAYAISQQLGDRYANIIVSDGADRELFRLGHEGPRDIIHPEGAFAGWFFDAAASRLYRVFYQPTPIAGGVAGHLVAVRSIDHAFVSTIAEPSSELYLLWSGRVVSSSLGEAGRDLPLRPDGYVATADGDFLQLTLPLDGTGGQGALRLRQRLTPLFPLGQLALAVVSFFLLLAAVLWLALGSWLVEVGRRLKALDAAGQIHVTDPRNSAAIGERLDRARSGLDDEVARVADSLQQLVEAVAVREEQRDAATAELRDSQGHLHDILATLPDAVYVVDEAGRLTFMNPETERLLGWPAAQALGADSHSLFHSCRSDGRTYHVEECPIHRCLQDGRRQEPRQDAVMTRSGRLIPVWLAASPLLKQGRPAGAVVAFSDLTERLRIEEALTQSEARFRHIFNAGNDAVFVIEARPDGTPGRFLEANEVACRRFGYTREELLAMGPLDLNRDKETLAAAYRDLAAQGRSMFERVYVTRSGIHIPVEISLRRFEYQGQPAFLTVVRDITERKAAERRVRELADLNQKIIEESTLGIAAYRAEGSCILANEAMARIVGAKLPQLLAQNFRTVASWKSSPLFETALQALASDQSRRCEAQMVTSFGRQVWVDCYFVPFLSAGDAHLLLLANDITQYRLAEQTQRDAKSAAEEASRAKSEFLSNMSHEIRTPLNAIVGLTHLALAGDPPPRQRDYLTKIELSSKSLIGIINDLLDFSKIEAGKLELELAAFELDDVLRNATHQFLPAADDKGLEIVIDIDIDVPTHLIGDALRLTQVLNNLLGNAVKFTERGEIRVAVRRLARDFDQVTLRFAVHDSGIGLKPEQRDRLFSPFTQADGSITRRFGGTGLGLAISKRLVERMGGQIGVESAFGEGSEFWFTARLGIAAQPDERAGRRFQGRRALVADDLESMRTLLAGMLSSWGMETVTAADGREALAALEHSGPFDLVILDWKMPVLDGIAAARAMAGHWRKVDGERVPVLIMATAFSREEAKLAAAGVAIDAIIDKPVTPSALLDAIVACKDKDLGKAAGSVPPGEAQDMAGALAGLHVLVVEDNDINRQVAREILESAGIRVSLAEDGRQALDFLTAAPTVDAVLMDVHMPVMDGLEATRQLRRMPSGRKLPVIAMTAAAMTQDRDACFAAGMDEHVAKPIDPAQLFEKLAHCTGRALRQWQARRAADPVVALPALAEFALDEALERLGGNRQLLLDFLHRFAAEFAPTAAELRAAVGKGDLAEAQRITHRLAGVAGNLGAKRLAAEACEAEASLRRGEVPANLERLGTCIEASVAQAGSVGQAGAAPTGATQAEMLAVLAELRPVLAQNGFVTIEQRDRLQAVLAGAPPAREAAALIAALERIDYAAAATALDTLVAALEAAAPPSDG